jgi:uncharacterized protein
VNEIVAGVMGHYNSVAAVLQSQPGKYGAIYDTDERTGDVFWECWAAGFARAIALRPDAWDRLLAVDDEYSTAFILLATMGALARSGDPPSDEHADIVRSKAAMIIPSLVETLNEWRLNNTADATGWPAATRPKQGRNDLCACGSEKKFKKCCGAN